MNKETTKEMLTTIEIMRECVKNTMEVTLESYGEILTKLEFLELKLSEEEK